MTKEIELSKGQVAIVDDWRYEELNKYKWWARWDSNTKSYRAVRTQRDVSGNKKLIFMHRVVAGTPDNMQTDHIDRNTLHNTEQNLRACTASQNQQNRGKAASNTSGYKGVAAHGKGWEAKIKVKNKTYHLGTYKTAKDAARVYDEAAKRMHGEFAVLNFP